MKKLMSTMLAMAAMASLISCSTEDILNQETPGTDNNGLVPIKMTAQMGGLTTKALVPQDDEGNLKDDLTDVHFLRFDAETADAAAPDWSSLGDLLAAKIQKADRLIVFTNPQYYQNNGYKTYLFGCHPTPTKTADNKLEWELDGSKDIIISNVQSGDKTTTGDGLTFTFDHQLTLLKFNVRFPDGTTKPGEQLTSITVKDQSSSVTYNPQATGTDADPKLTFSTTLQPMTTKALTNDQDITTSSISGGYLLVEPSAAEKEFKIEVKTQSGSGADLKEYTYSGTINMAAAEKTAYDVNLIIDQKQVSGTASVTNWIPGVGPGDQTIY